MVRKRCTNFHTHTSSKPTSKNIRHKKCQFGNCYSKSKNRPWTPPFKYGLNLHCLYYKHILSKNSIKLFNKLLIQTFNDGCHGLIFYLL